MHLNLRHLSEVVFWARFIGISMVSDLMFKMNELKKKPGFNEFMSILIDTIEQPERPLLEIINDKVI